MIGLYKIARYRAFKTPAIWMFQFAALFLLTACATWSATTPAQLEAYPNAITVPFRLSDSGHIMIDISVNGHEKRPFIIDSGANGSAIYERHLEAFDLTSSEELTSVHGLVTSALRPMAENVELQIGAQIFENRNLVLLETPSATTQVSGLLGVDVLADYAAVFNTQTQAVSFIPSADLTRKSFSGWRKIPLRNQVGSLPDKGLYFATIILKGRPAAVLVDTGSDMNIVNWHLAKEEDSVRRLEKSLRKILKLQGALDTVPLRMKAQFNDVKLGNQTWPKLDVVVMEFDSLSSIAPVDGPMMIAGVKMFTGSSFAFDFGGNAIYIHKDNLPSG